jgi:hypothetical protein
LGNPSLSGSIAISPKYTISWGSSSLANIFAPENKNVFEKTAEFEGWINSVDQA